MHETCTASQVPLNEGDASRAGAPITQLPRSSPVLPERPPPSGRSFVLRGCSLFATRARGTRLAGISRAPPTGTRGPDRGLHECDRELKRQPDRPDDDRQDEEEREFGLHVVCKTPRRAIPDAAHGRR
jgi:hypothetical protein